MKTILFQGDSITDANRSADEKSIFCMGHGYATMTAAMIGCDCPGQYAFFNRGVSGDKIVNILERRNRDIINLKPDYMSILVGVNDVGMEIKDSDGTSADLYELCYDVIIGEALAALPELKIAIMEPFILRNPAQEAYYGELQSGIRARAAAAERIARKYRLTFLPLQSKFDEAAERSGDPAHWLYDGVHPTPAGHKLIAEEWYEKFYQTTIKERKGD